MAISVCEPCSQKPQDCLFLLRRVFLWARRDLWFIQQPASATLSAVSHLNMKTTKAFLFLSHVTPLLILCLSQASGDSQRSLCCWCRCCIRGANWGNLVQFGGGLILFPTKGTYSIIRNLIADVFSRSCGEGGLSCFNKWNTYRPPSSFFCAMIAAITLKLLDPFGTGKLVLFQVTYERVQSIFFVL